MSKTEQSDAFWMLQSMIDSLRDGDDLGLRYLTGRANQR
jgi:hypothetical protein